MQEFHRDTWVEVNLDYIYDNVASMKQMLPQDVKMFAVVKANAYGHGDYEVASTALKAGADFWLWPFWMRPSYCDGEVLQCRF